MNEQAVKIPEGHRPKQISIPFMAAFRGPMRQDIKTKTSRTTIYGYPGDWFNQWGETFQIVALERWSLAYIAEKWWKQEGARNEEEFRQIWRSIHVKAGWNPAQLVYVHTFERVRDDEPRTESSATLYQPSML